VFELDDFLRASIPEECHHHCRLLSRGVHPEYVFVYTPKTKRAKPGQTAAAPVDAASNATDTTTTPTPQPLKRMNGTAWRNARERAADKWEQEKGEKAPMGFRRVRVHDMKHSFGRRLRAAGVSYRGSAGFAGAQEWEDHHPRFQRRAGEPDRGCGKCVSRRVPQSPAGHLITEEVGVADVKLTA
jgi:hypothetical protein